VEALLDLRKRLRQEQSRGIVKRIETTLLEWKPGLLPRSEFGKAVLYMMKLWTGLILFLSNPAIPLDNNAVERAQRGPVVGRKNHYGSKSRRGTEVAAIFYTLIETAKLWDVDPGRYLLAVLRNAVANPGAVTLPAGLLEE
jgi:transposase